MYVKFQDSQSLIECTVVPNGNIVTMKFPNSVIVDTSGFRLFLDEKGEYDIGGDDYLRFTTIYRNDEETEKYNSYQLSNDGSIWTAEVQEETILTDEEVAEQERQNRISELNNKIYSLKNEIASTDYIFTKQYEASLVGETLTEYDYYELHEQRQKLRDEINVAQDELNNLLNNEEEL